MFTYSDFISPYPELRSRHSSKWRRFEPDVLPMHVAEMDYVIAPNIQRVLIDFVQRSDLGYLGPIPEVPAAFSEFAMSRWGWKVDPAQVRIATDVAVGCVEIMRALGRPGDRVVINSPVYSSFYDWIKEVQMEAQDVPLIPRDGTWKLDIDGLRAAFESGAKFLLLCSPQNPVGRVHTALELGEIALLAKRFGVTVISDEIHAPLTFKSHQFVPWLSVSETAREVGVAVTAASKSFNLAGLKAAVFVSQNESMQQRLQAVPAATHWRSSLLGGFAMAEAFANSEDWLNTAIEQNASNFEVFESAMRELLPSVPYWVPQAGYLAWMDLSSLNLGPNPAATILERGRVALVPGVDHGKGYEQFARINFATHPEHIYKTIEAIRSLHKS
jgi:cystathionine beta-lyase